MTPAELRAHVASALTGLAPDADDDWPVHDAPVDSVTPPCFVLVWPDQWLTQQSVCTYRAQLQIICVAARIEPAPGYEQLEQLVDAALPALTRARVPLVAVGAALPFEIGGLQYQAARITVAGTVTLTGGMP
ncbi:MAG TPA: hypothetical protein VKB59_22505 [Micromonosporaceae bacterium]|nr:hypothetical protein [Micromonosporaceae bacterium]